MPQESFDVIVVGSGAGLKIARAAAAAGLETVLVEESEIGGTCLLRGCIPSKMLIYPADFLELCRRAKNINLDVPELPRVRFAELVDRVDGTVRRMSAEIEEKLAATPHLTTIRGHARFHGQRRLAVGDRIISAERIFLALGSRPAVPEIPGLAGTPFMTSREALRNRELPPRLAVLGAGYIACELGHAYGAFGSETHFIIRSSLLRNEDSEIRDIFRESFSARHGLRERTTPQRITHRDGVFLVDIRSPDGQTARLECDGLLVAAGSRPATGDLNPGKGGIELDERGFVEVDDYLRTGAAGVYALGDCVGRYFYRHSANREADYLIRSVLQQRKSGPMHYGPIPHAVFTVPEIAGLGATEDELRERNIPYICGRAAYADSNQGLARAENTGLVKILASPVDGRLLGAHAIGEEAANLIHIPAALMYRDGTIDDLLEMVYIHPALPEIVRDAARDAAAKPGGR